MVAAPPAKVITWEEYLNLPDDLVRYEIIDGEVIELATPTFQHQRQIGKLFRYLSQKYDDTQFAYVLTAPYDVVISRNPVRTRQPDLLFILKERADAIEDLQELSRIDIPPDLVIEVLAPSESAESVLDKMRDYFKMGVREMWLLNPAKKTVELFQADNGSYRPSGFFTGDQVIQSAVLPDLDLTPDRIFE